MGIERRFSQVDVFTAEPLQGNPLAVVHDASGLSDAQMAALACCSEAGGSMSSASAATPGSAARFVRW